ncbi:MAG: hypothetical protein ACFBSG_16610 [Leptolyngbyaceae cyanobacterium]
MASNPHFQAVADWQQAADWLAFTPRCPNFTAASLLRSLAIYVVDHHSHPIPKRDRIIEAHYDGFCIAQQRCRSVDEASYHALSVAYGTAGEAVSVAGYVGCRYALGPVTAPDDIDGRIPAVVVWHEQERFYLVASTRLRSEALLQIAVSMYAR